MTSIYELRGRVSFIFQYLREVLNLLVGLRMTSGMDQHTVAQNRGTAVAVRNYVMDLTVGPVNFQIALAFLTVTGIAPIR